MVVLNADGKAFLAHNMVLFDDDRWTSELVGLPGSRQIEGLSRDTFTFVHDVCATLALVMDLHLAASSPSLPFILRQDRQVGLLLPPQDQHLAVLSARAHAVEMKASLNELNEGQSQVVAFVFRTDSGPLNVLINSISLLLVLSDDCVTVMAAVANSVVKRILDVVHVLHPDSPIFALASKKHAEPCA